MRPDQGEDYFDIQEEKQLAWRDRWEMFAGMSNFFSVVLGVVVILLLILLLASLIHWLRNDIIATFTMMNARF